MGAGIDEQHEELTRKQRRDQARAQRKQAEQAVLASAARRTRLTQLAIVLAVVVIGIVAVLIGTGGGARKGIPPPGERPTNQISALLGGIPQKANVLGRSTAPVTLQYFGDLECPVCREFTLTALPSIIQRWVRGGELKIEYRSLETATREAEVFKAQQVAALAAGRQDKMWNFVETFYHEQGEEDSGYATEGYIQDIAKQVPGLDLATWMSDRNDVALADEVASDGQAANGDGLEGTPAFLIGRSGSALRRFEPSSFTESGSFDEAIEKLARTA